MNEKKYIAHLKAYKFMLSLQRLAENSNKTNKQEKTVRPGVREISPVSIYGEIYGGKDSRKRFFKSRVKKRTSD